jgi:acyl carrier protein
MTTLDGAIGDVRRLLASVVGSEIVDSLEDDELFFDHGVVDSLRLVEIIECFQSDLRVAVSGRDLSPENFGSISGMARFLQSKR